MTDQSIVLRYHEIALKGDNRTFFEKCLAENVRKIVQRALGENAPPVTVTRYRGRMIVKAPWNPITEGALRRVFGLANFSPMKKVKTTREALLEAVLEEFEKQRLEKGLPRSFRIKTRRSEKALPESSTDLDRLLGSIIKDRYPEVQVDLTHPEFIIGVELRFEESFLWTERIHGLQGLPVGSNARILSLISGGIDSPVAAIQTLKRGSPLSFVHFYGTPYVGEEVLDKILRLVEIVNRYQPYPQPLHVIPFGKIQEKIAQATNPKFRTLLYRRMMIRIANELAVRLHAKALVTGESLGQVASQTIENLAIINEVAHLPVIRPLITDDKDEIIEKAKKWETYPISIEPGVDCCTLFADRHPTLRATQTLIEEQEARFSISELIEQALSMMEIRGST